MKHRAWTLLALAASIASPLPASAQWIRSQFNDAASGDLVTTYRLDANPDPGGSRKPYLLITCDPHGKRYSDSYYTDAPMALDTRHRDSDGAYLAVNLEFRGESTKPKTERRDTGPGLKTIELDSSVMQVVATQSKLILRFPSVSGAMIMDTFDTRDFPFDRYTADCFPTPRLLKRTSQ
jgi:hypothetical protein